MIMEKSVRYHAAYRFFLWFLFLPQYNQISQSDIRDISAAFFSPDGCLLEE